MTGFNKVVGISKVIEWRFNLENPFEKINICCALFPLKPRVSSFSSFFRLAGRLLAASPPSSEQAPRIWRRVPMGYLQGGRSHRRPRTDIQNDGSHKVKSPFCYAFCCELHTLMRSSRALVALSLLKTISQFPPRRRCAQLQFRARRLHEPNHTPSLPHIITTNKCFGRSLSAVLVVALLLKLVEDCLAATGPPRRWRTLT